MNRPPIYLQFETVPEGELMLRKYRELYSDMVGNIYPNVVAEYIIAIKDKIEELKKTERPRGVSVAHILEKHFMCQPDWQD
jgi:hypothetical protein